MIKMPGEMISVLKSRPESEINGFFKAYKEDACMRLPACQNDDERRNLQALVKGIDEMHQFFLSEMRRKQLQACKETLKDWPIF